MKLTDHFTLAEFCDSDTAARLGIDNTPPDDMIQTLTRTAQGMERIRTILRAPIHINSAYRCPALNAAVGSKPTSQHMKGEAVDFVCPGYGPPEKVCKLLLPLMTDLGIDQLIIEFGRWVHVSFTDKPRRMALTIDRNGTREGIA